MSNPLTRTWLIPDAHFFHENMVTKAWRPPNYEAQLKYNWYSQVAKTDVVVLLGDIILGHKDMLKSLLDDLPGKKIGVRGNHDKESDSWYMRNGIDFFCQGYLQGQVWLTHYPQETLPDGAVLNVHGHLHTNNRKTPSHCRLVSLERSNYNPILLDDFVGFPANSRKVQVPWLRTDIYATDAPSYTENEEQPCN